MAEENPSWNKRDELRCRFQDLLQRLATAATSTAATEQEDPQHYCCRRSKDKCVPAGTTAPLCVSRRQAAAPLAAQLIGRHRGYWQPP